MSELQGIQVREFFMIVGVLQPEPCGEHCNLGLSSTFIAGDCSLTVAGMYAMHNDACVRAC